MDYDSAVLESIARQFRREMWKSVVPEAVTESGVEVRSFGPVQATAFGDLPEVRALNQIQGAAEPGAIEDGHLAAAVEWMRAREVDYLVPVAEGRPGAERALSWLGERGYERGGTTVKLIRDAGAHELPEHDPAVTIYELGYDEADGEGLSIIITEALDMPVTAGTLFFSLPLEEHWRCYTAAPGPEEGIVATASMMIEDGVAQLGPGATLEHPRGRDCNRALLRRRLLDAAEAGCHTIFVELGGCELERYASVYDHLLDAGFAEAYGSQVWRRPALRPAAVS
jgi:hypothetical protein